MSRPWYHAAFAGPYSELYRHRDGDEARRAIDTVAKVLRLADADVLDLGCGAGRHLPHLRRHGARVTGLDLSADLLAEARADFPDQPLLRGDWTGLPLDAASFDAVISLFTAFGYGEHDEDQARHMAEVSRVLRSGGAWCLDYLNPRLVRAELASPPPPREREIGGCLVREQRSLSAAGDRVLKSVSWEPLGAARPRGVPADGLRYQESVALLDLPRLDAMAAAAGLQRSDALGDYDGAPLAPDTSPRWLLFYRKDMS